MKKYLHGNDQLLVTEKLFSFVRLLAEVGRHVTEAVVLHFLFLFLPFGNDGREEGLEDLHVVLHALVDRVERWDELEAGGADDGSDGLLHGEGLDVIDHLDQVLVVVVEPTAAHQLPDDVERRHVEEAVHLDCAVLKKLHVMVDTKVESNLIVIDCTVNIDTKIERND